MDKNLPPLPSQVSVIPNQPQLKAPPPIQEIPSSNGDPLKFLEAMMDNVTLDIRLRLEAAKTLAPYKHAKLGEQGIKSKQQDAANSAHKTGRFGQRGSTPMPPLPH